MPRLVPDFAYTDIFQVTPEQLKKAGVRGLILDLDGTLASYEVAQPTDAQCRLIKGYLNAGIQVMMLSNNNHPQRVAGFCAALGIPYLCRAKKPLKSGFLKCAKALGLPPAQIAVIGDQIYTDVFGAHRAGMKAIFVKSLLSGRLYNLRYCFERVFVSRAPEGDHPERKWKSS